MQIWPLLYHPTTTPRLDRLCPQRRLHRCLNLTTQCVLMSTIQQRKGDAKTKPPSLLSLAFDVTNGLTPRNVHTSVRDRRRRRREAGIGATPSRWRKKGGAASNYRGERGLSAARAIFEPLMAGRWAHQFNTRERERKYSREKIAAIKKMCTILSSVPRNHGYLLFLTCPFECLEWNGGRIKSLSFSSSAERSVLANCTGRGIRF